MVDSGSPLGCRDFRSMESRVAAELEPGPAWGNQPERPTATTFTRVGTQGICFHTSFLRSDRSVDY